MNRLVYSLCAAMAVGTCACVIVVDDTGSAFHSAWSDGWREQYQGSGTSAAQARQVPEFSKLSLRGSPDAYVRIGTEASVTVTCDDNLLERFDTRVEDGTLVVEMKPGSYRFKAAPKVEIVVAVLDTLKVSGSADAVVEGLSGGSFTTSISGSGSVTASGTVDSVSAAISGSGDIKLGTLVARDVRVSISGSGDADVTANGALEVQISGSGDVRYRGTPTQVTKSISGSGSVTRH